MALSTSLSAENLTGNNETSSDTSSMCLELALEGERLCKSGDCRAGVAFFQAAISSGTNDLRFVVNIISRVCLTLKNLFLVSSASPTEPLVPFIVN